MKETDVNLLAFSDALIRKHSTIPLIAVYCAPEDYPGQYVARLWDMSKPTRFVVTGENLEDIRKAIPESMSILGKSAEDDPCIVEVYV